jgi:hypothetical protein
MTTIIVAPAEPLQAKHTAAPPEPRDHTMAVKCPYDGHVFRVDLETGDIPCPECPNVIQAYLYKLR